MVHALVPGMSRCSVIPLQCVAYNIYHITYDIHHTWCVTYLYYALCSGTWYVDLCSSFPVVNIASAASHLSVAQLISLSGGWSRDPGLRQPITSPWPLSPNAPSPNSHQTLSALSPPRVRAPILSMTTGQLSVISIKTTKQTQTIDVRQSDIVKLVKGPRSKTRISR